MDHKTRSRHAVQGFSRESLELLARAKQETATQLRSLVQAPDLLRALDEYVATLTREAEGLTMLVKSIRRGRPPKVDLNRLLGGRIKGFQWVKPMAPPGKPGRPLAVDIGDDDLIRALTEGKRAGPPRSERAILEDVARHILSRNGKHSAGSRAKRMAANLQKRVASIRARRVPKQTTKLPEIAG